MAGIVRLDKVRSVYVGNIFDVVSDETLENGMIGVLGELVDGEREVRKLAKPTDLEQGEMVVIASPEIMYDEYKRTDGALANFKIDAGTVARAYTLAPTDILSVSKDLVKALATDVVKGNVVTGTVGAYKFEEKATATTEKFVARIIGVEKIGRGLVIGQAGKIERTTEFVVLEVIKA